MSVNDLEIPDYLNQEFFAETLKSGMLINPKIKSLDICAGSSNGDNYCSDIYRVVVVYDNISAQTFNQEISLIVKAMPYLPHRGPILENLDVFRKELAMYIQTLPIISESLNNEFLCAKHFYSVSSPVQTIVFQDLVPLGYKMPDREKGLDKAHSILVMTKLAKLHAGSYALAEKNSDAMKQYSFGVFCDKAIDTPVLRSMITNGVQYLIKEVKKWPNFEIIAKKMSAISSDLKARLSHHLKDTHCMYKVLNHGDLWMNNILFKYDCDQNPSDVVFVDYQMSYYSSPGIDINYYLVTSGRDRLTESEKNELIVTYYDVFKACLQKLNLSNIPTFDMLKSEIAAREFYGLIVSMIFLPLMLLDKETSQESSMDALEDETKKDRIREAMYNNPTYQKTMKILLTRFYNLNVI